MVFCCIYGIVFHHSIFESVVAEITEATVYIHGVFFAFLLPIINCYAAGTVYSNGYNLAWLTVLYVVGAYIKRFSPVFIRSSWLLVFALCSTLLPLGCALFELPVSFDYAQPLTVAYALAFFILFTRINITSSVARRFIAWAAPSAFAVYLIHVHPWSWYMLCKYTRELNICLDYPWWCALVFGLVIYVTCTCLDRVRIHLFRLLRLRRVAEVTADAITMRVLLIYRKLF